MESINDKYSNEHTGELNYLDIGKLLNSDIKEINTDDLRIVENKINSLIENKIQASEIDAQALPILKKINNEIKDAKLNINKYWMLLKKEHDLDHEASEYAKSIVNKARSEREEAIKATFKEKIKEQKIFEKEDESRRNKNKKEIRDIKLQRKQYKAELKRQKQEAKLNKVKDKLSKEKINWEEEQNTKLTELQRKKIENAHKITQLEKELAQQEHEASVKRAQINEELEAKLGQQKKEWNIKQKKLEKKWELENDEMIAKHAAKIAQTQKNIDNKFKDQESNKIKAK